MSGFAADFAGAEIRPSPNFGERRGGAEPDAIVLHYTGMESGPAAEDWLCDPASEVSSHYLVHEDGRVVQMVAERARAWHAGAGSWRGREDVNSFSIGIEIVNPGHFLGYRDFPDAQIASVVVLCRDICARRNILPERVLAHSDVAPGRKIDPGEKFPWARLAAEGIGRFPVPAALEKGEILAEGAGGHDVRELQSRLAAYGYAIEPTALYDARTKVVVEAFQRHFRPALIDGRADPSTRLTLEALLACDTARAGRPLTSS
jgi:N-acetylmuramoyl-L-alanine amidase